MPSCGMFGGALPTALITTQRICSGRPSTSAMALRGGLHILRTIHDGPDGLRLEAQHQLIASNLDRLARIQQSVHRRMGPLEGPTDILPRMRSRQPASIAGAGSALRVSRFRAGLVDATVAGAIALTGEGDWDASRSNFL